MTPQAWIAVLSAICAVLVTVTTWGFLSGRFSSNVEQRLQQLANELHDYKAESWRRFEQAGKETSDAWTYVQGLESRFIREFVSRDLADTRFDDCRRDIDYLRSEIDKMKANTHHQ